MNISQTNLQLYLRAIVETLAGDWLPGVLCTVKADLEIRYQAQTWNVNMCFWYQTCQVTHVPTLVNISNLADSETAGFLTNTLISRAHFVAHHQDGGLCRVKFRHVSLANKVKLHHLLHTLYTNRLQPCTRKREPASKPTVKHSDCALHTWSNVATAWQALI